MTVNFTLRGSSLKKLADCHKDLRILAEESIKDSPYNFIITHGYRLPEEQFELYKKGRTEIEGKWVQTGSVVTYLDGYIKKSKHNEHPSLAFDVGILLNNIITWSVPSYIELSKHILKVADELFEKDLIQNRITWGGNWSKFKDYPHYQI